MSGRSLDSPWRRRAERAVALVVAAPLLGSAYAHLGNPYQFLATVFSYQLVGPDIGLIVATWVPYLQLSLAACLFARWWPAACYTLCGLLFAAFLTAQASVYWRGLDISCGCFGSGQSAIGPGSLSVPAGALVLSVAGLMLAGWRPSGGPARDW